MAKRSEKKKSAKKVLKSGVTKPKKHPRVKAGAGKTTQKTARRAVKKVAEESVLTKKNTVRRTRAGVVKLALVQAPDWHAFYAVNGAVLRSLTDLARELEMMLESEYIHHKDHFASWVRDILSDTLCADDLSKAATRTKARKVVETHLKRYNV